VCPLQSLNSPETAGWRRAQLCRQQAITRKKLGAAISIAGEELQGLRAQNGVCGWARPALIQHAEAQSCALRDPADSREFLRMNLPRTRLRLGTVQAALHEDAECPASGVRLPDHRVCFVHNNPVNCCLVKEPGDWPWSSRRFY